MGREVRRVPADWEHPKWNNPHRGWEYRPMFDQTHADAVAEWEGDKKEQKGKWDARTLEYVDDDIYKTSSFEDYFDENYGEKPDPQWYMPDWKDEERTHLMMYENTSEGTPLSPAFETPEELARWLTDNGASSFGAMTATYEQWLGMCRSGWAPSAIMTNGVLESGVAALHGKEQADEQTEVSDV